MAFKNWLRNARAPAAATQQHGPISTVDRKVNGWLTVMNEPDLKELA